MTKVGDNTTTVKRDVTDDFETLMSDSKKGHEEDDESFESLMQFEKKQMKKVQPLK